MPRAREVDTEAVPLRYPQGSGCPHLTALVAALVLIATARPVRADATDSDKPELRCRELVQHIVEGSPVGTHLLGDRSTPSTTGTPTDLTPLFDADEVMLATLPDLTRVPAGETFDSALEALRTGMDSLGYVRDRVVLPAEAATGTRRALFDHHCPGVLIFRQFPASARKDPTHSAKQTAAWPAAIAVLTVGESWSSGLDLEAMRTALGLVKRDAGSLRVLGPYYSASAESFVQATRAAPAELQLTVRSGSMAVESMACAVQKNPRTSDFRTFAANLDLRRKTLCEWQLPDACHPPPDAACNEPTALPEPSTAPGTETSVSSAREPPQLIKSVASLRTLGTPYGSDDQRYFKFELRLSFPANVSELRTLETGLSAQRAKTKPQGATPQGDDAAGAGAASKQSGASRSEILGWSDPQHSSDVYRVSVREAARALRDHDVSKVYITSERVHDAIHLAQLMKQETPDLRIIFDHWDLAFLRPDYTTDLHGSLVVTTYPPERVDEHARRDGALRPQDYLFTISRDQARGVYEATRALFCVGDRVAQDTCKQPPLRANNPSPTLAVIAGARMIPLTGEVAVRTPAVFMVAVLLLAWIAWADHTRLRMLRGVIPPDTSHAPWLGKIWNKFFCLVGVPPCQDGTVLYEYNRTLLTAKLALVSMWIQLAGTWVGAFVLGEAPRKVTHIVVFVGLALASFWSVAAAGSAFRLWLQSTPETPGPGADGDLQSKPKEQGQDPYGWRPLAVSAVLVFALPVLGVLGLATTRDRSALLNRSLDLTCGASPLAVTLMCTFVVYACACFHARKLRVLDRSLAAKPGAPTYVDPKTHKPSKQNGLQLLAAESHGGTELDTSVLLPWRATLVISGALLSAMIAIPPLAAWLPRGFTLEDFGLHCAIALGLVMVVFVIALLGVQLWSLFRAFSELLCRLAASDLVKAFEHTPWPRTVAQHLWRYWPEEAEIDALFRSFHASADETERQLLDQAEALATRDKRFALLEAAKHRRRLLDDEAREQRNRCRSVADTRSWAKAKERARRENQVALAGLVTFELAGWLRQITALMTSITIATTGLLACSWLYVFGVRRLMVTVSALLSVGAVVLGIFIFASLERDPVLNRIGQRATGGKPVQVSWRRIASVGVLPVLLALATYYPGASAQLVDWLGSLLGR